MRRGVNTRPYAVFFEIIFFLESRRGERAPRRKIVRGGVMNSGYGFPESCPAGNIFSGCVYILDAPHAGHYDEMDARCMLVRGRRNRRE